MSELMEQWKDFNVAMAGATAALAGLVIVAASVNIADIVKATSLTARLAGGISALVLAIAASAVGLIPGLTVPAYGIVLILFALGAGVFQAQAAREIFANRHPENRLRIVKAGVGFLAPGAYFIAGALLLAGVESGLVWAAAGAILAIISSLVVSWVVLVEVLR